MKAIGHFDAKLQGVPLAAPPERPVVVHCWRGGLRSRSVLALLRSLGLERAVGLEGGYRNWRRRVMEGLAAWGGVNRTVSLRGLTGTGKTLVLREIERLRPRSTLDLEGLAGHRSSLLGMVGLEPVSQKSFESKIFERLGQGFAQDTLIVEGESRKVGDVVVPGLIWEAMGTATNLSLEASMERRVDVLVDDYLARDSALPQLREQLGLVAGRMESAPDLQGMLDRGEVRELVEVLLTDYYDPLYKHSEGGKVYAGTIDTGDPTAAAEAILSFVDKGPC